MDLDVVNEARERAKKDLEDMVKSPVFQDSLKQIEQAYSLASQELLKLSELHQLKSSLFDKLKDAQKVLDDINKRKAEKLIPMWIQNPRPSDKYANYDQATKELGEIKDFMEDVDGKTHLEIPPIETDGNETLKEAIRDAQLLFDKNGAPNAVDRFHTVLHSFLQDQCKKENIFYEKDDSVNVLLKKIREQHPKIIILQKKEPYAMEVLKGMGNTLKNLSESRNNKSLAHPNEALLPDDEANFIIESVNSILKYLSTKLG
ncbi:MAG: hypothetical protein ACD_15C00137G0028 [uncultured bacterium]|nr:MAG: hypothetical protein ACD_15C00137G0028 [uncultured bacterium]